MTPTETDIILDAYRVLAEMFSTMTQHSRQMNKGMAAWSVALCVSTVTPSHGLRLGFLALAVGIGFWLLKTTQDGRERYLGYLSQYERLCNQIDTQWTFESLPSPAYFMYTKMCCYGALACPVIAVLWLSLPQHLLSALGAR